jgi:hypothetical protein
MPTFGNPASPPETQQHLSNVYSTPVLAGFPGPGDGVGDVSHNAWDNNMTSLVWTITSPFVTLNATVYYTLNTSGRAPRGDE